MRRFSKLTLVSNEEPGEPLKGTGVLNVREHASEVEVGHGDVLGVPVHVQHLQISS